MQPCSPNPMPNQPHYVHPFYNNYGWSGQYYPPHAMGQHMGYPFPPTFNYTTPIVTPTWAQAQHMHAPAPPMMTNEYDRSMLSSHQSDNPTNGCNDHSKLCSTHQCDSPTNGYDRYMLCSHTNIAEIRYIW
jgi:hypothetical protein